LIGAWLVSIGIVELAEIGDNQKKGSESFPAK
jgi:hypothetical protein